MCDGRGPKLGGGPKPRYVLYRPAGLFDRSSRGQELKVLQVTLPDSLMSALEIQEFVMAVECYPNISIVYRILLTVLVTNFSKLKLFKNYLRSTIMSQER